MSRLYHGISNFFNSWRWVKGKTHDQLVGQNSTLEDQLKEKNSELTELLDQKRAASELLESLKVEMIPLRVQAAESETYRQDAQRLREQLRTLGDQYAEANTLLHRSMEAAQFQADQKIADLEEQNSSLCQRLETLQGELDWKPQQPTRGILAKFMDRGVSAPDTEAYFEALDHYTQIVPLLPRQSLYLLHINQSTKKSGGEEFHLTLQHYEPDFKTFQHNLDQQTTNQISKYHTQGVPYLLTNGKVTIGVLTVPHQKGGAFYQQLAIVEKTNYKRTDYKIIPVSAHTLLGLPSIHQKASVPQIEVQTLAGQQEYPQQYPQE